jgi:hypothetical protein
MPVPLSPVDSAAARDELLQELASLASLAKAVEWALQMTLLDLSSTERHPSMWAAIYGRAHHTIWIPPENHFLPQAGHPDRISPYH